MDREVSVSLNEYANNPGATPELLVAILMGTKNGERFLAEQLDSSGAQTYKHLDYQADSMLGLSLYWKKRFIKYLNFIKSLQTNSL